MTREQAIEAARVNPGVYMALRNRRPLSKFHRRTMAFSLRHQRWMKEEPRGHGKTVETAILMAWHGGRDTTLRQKISGSNDTEAVKTAKFIRREIESDLYQEVFPWATLDPKESAAE